MKCFLIISVLFCLSEAVLHPSIPQHLLPCYRGGGPPLASPKRLDVFLSLVRRLELNSQLNLRLFSSALLRSVRLDGIERAQNPVETEFVTPYRASAFQFTKYKLLMDLFVPSQALLEVDESLTLTEKCELHRMMSAAVYQWERGDEDVVCPAALEHSRGRLEVKNDTRRLNSRCPIEEGIMQTEWGTVSPGTLVSAIAAALESQRVSVSDVLNAKVEKEPLSTANEWQDEIETLNMLKQSQIANAEMSNVWVATLAGDLAEVAVNQGPRFTTASHRFFIGSNNRWNDTLLPRDYYLLVQNASTVEWHMTDAEILAGIDGLILAKYIPDWVNQRASLRLSQIIEMYYSNEGVFLEPKVKACNRQTLYSEVLDRTTLLTEMNTFAHVLALNQGTVYVNQEEVNRISDAVVTAFFNYLSNVLTQNHRECTTSVSLSTMDVIVVTDGAWKGYDVQQFMSWLGGSIDLGVGRGSIALLHGNTGDWIARPSYNLSELSTQISNFTSEWPNRLNFPRVLSTVIQHSLNKTLMEQSQELSVSPSTVVVVASPSDRLSPNEVERSRELMDSLRTSQFDVYFAYIAQDLTGYQNINNEYMDYSEVFIKTESTSVQDAIDAVSTDLIKNIVPKRIIGAHCPVNDTTYNQVPFEDFVSTSQQNMYRIHPYYLRQQPMTSVNVQNGGQGTLQACWWRGADASHTCQTLDARQTFIFNITDPCPSIDICLPAHFSVTAMSSLNICASTDCRLPQQVGYYLQHTGLRCLPLRGASFISIPQLNVVFVALFILL